MNNENNKLQTYEKLISAQSFEEQQTPEQARTRVAEIQGSENAALEQEVAQLKQKYETSKNEKKAMRQARVQAIQNQKEQALRDLQSKQQEVTTATQNLTNTHQTKLQEMKTAFSEKSNNLVANLKSIFKTWSG